MRSALTAWTAVVLLLGALALSASPACGGGGPSLTVFAASSLSDVFPRLGDLFEGEHPGVEVRFSFGGSQRLRLHLEGGARADLLATADAAEVTDAWQAGVVVGPPGEPFARSGLVLVVHGALADVGSLEALLASGARVVLAAPSVPAGRLTLAVLEQLGLWDEVSRAVVSEEDNVRAVLTKVQVGEADAGFVYRTDALAAGDSVRTIRLPATDLANAYYVARTVDASEANLADAFISFLYSPSARRLLAAAGFIVPLE